MSVLSCINQLLKNHSADPFGVLREAGVQAELRGMLLEVFPERVDADIVQTQAPKRFIFSNPVYTKRVQLEMKICSAVNEDNQLRADLVVLKNQKVQLTCHGNGPGDIVAALRPEDVGVAVEVKASPSRTTEQQQQYASDLKRLLDLNEHHGIEGFFVFIDKSHSRFGTVAPGRWAHRAVDMDNWKTLLVHLEAVQITVDKPDNAAASAHICYLCPEGNAQHAFAWRAVANA